MFEDLGLVGNAAILLASLLVLDRASGLTIANSVKVADATGFGRTTIGFILVAFSTSLPELFVSIFSALGEGTIGVAVGNVLGSNIANICLILGVCKKFESSDVSPFIAKKEIKSLYFGLFVASIIPLSLVYITYASQIVGIILLVIFIVYMYQLSKIKNRKRRKESALIGL